jgi:putative peptidoglycan lipid II flippase
LLSEPVSALAWGVLGAGVVQLLFQMPALLRLGLWPRLRVDFKDPRVKLTLNRMLPAIFSVSVTQINLLLDSLVASFLVVGSVSWLYYSDRLVEFPLGILGTALATVILPNLSKSHAVENTAAFSNALDWGLRLVFLVGLPATIGLCLLAEPMLSTLFQYHEFTVADVHFAGQSLRAYSVGLLGYLFIKILVPAFTARHDMKTPLRYGIYAMVISFALNILAIPLAHAGLALATSLGAFINAILLLRKLLQDRIYLPAKGWGSFFARIIAASMAMSVCLYNFVDAAWWPQWSAGERVINLVMWIAIGMAVYALTLLLTGIRPRHLMVGER